MKLLNLTVSIPSRASCILLLMGTFFGAERSLWAQGKSKIGQEVAIPRHLQNGEEYQVSVKDLINFGRQLFTATWTIQDGVGRPQTKGSGKPLSDPRNQLVFPRNFNRISGPVANSCSGCHNKPDIGGGGDIIANFFLKGPRFDFATFDRQDTVPLKGAVDELSNPVTLQSIANSRKTTGMFGSGFIEMLARQITADLQVVRDSISPGSSGILVSKGIRFGSLRRNSDGSWDTSLVEGIAAPSLASTGPRDPPSLIIRPFQQNGNVISLRDFTIPTFSALHGIQSEETVGVNLDAGDDGVVSRLTRADITAVTIFQATLPVPVQVISDEPKVADAVRVGQNRFRLIGCPLVTSLLYRWITKAGCSVSRTHTTLLGN